MSGGFRLAYKTEVVLRTRQHRVY